MTFDTAFDRVLGYEGGYVNDPFDPGGETNWGISKRSYPRENIRELSRDTAKYLYARDFWNPLHADQMSDGVAFQLFDFAVNSGTQTAIRKLQSALGVADDGHWGPVSQQAMSNITDSDLVMRFLAQRLRFMSSLKNWTQHGKGWVRRIATNLEYGALDA